MNVVSSLLEIQNHNLDSFFCYRLFDRRANFGPSFSPWIYLFFLSTHEHWNQNSCNRFNIIIFTVHLSLLIGLDAYWKWDSANVDMARNSFPAS